MGMSEIIKGNRLLHLGSALIVKTIIDVVARCSSVVKAFAQGAMDCRIDPSWWTNNYLAFFIYKLIILWTISIN